MPARLKRVRKSGNLARAFVIPPATLFLVATAVGTQAPREFSLGEWILIGLFIAIPTIAIVLSLFVGIWASEEQLRVRSWFATHRFQRPEVRSLDIEEYSGAWRLWPFDSAFLMLVIERVDGPFAIFPSTIATHRSLVEQIRQLDERWGMQSFAARPSQSHAAIRDARSRAWRRSRRSRDGP